MNASLDHGNRDSGDYDGGDYDSTEVRNVAVNAWHPSFLPGVPGALGSRTQIGKQYLDSLKSKTVKPVPRVKRAPQFLTCWRDTPQSLRELVASVAGLSFDITRKMDRDLTEVEKAKLRQAVGKIRDRVNSLVAL
jgi:hypothetical protein